MPVPDPVLSRAKPGDLVGIEVGCPRGDCDWCETYASAEVVNEYGVRDPMPARCKVHGLPVVVEQIVEVIGEHEKPRPQTHTGPSSESPPPDWWFADGPTQLEHLCSLIGLRQFFHAEPLPARPLFGVVREVYLGLQDQARVCFVDGVGRVHHHDFDELARNAGFS